MVSRFRGVDRAIAYMCNGVGCGVSKGSIEVTYYPNGSEARESNLRELTRLRVSLEVLCNRFQHATVAFELDRSNATIAAIQCMCDRSTQSVCAHHCRHSRERPIVTLIPCSPAERPSDEKKQKVLDKVHKSIHDYYVEDRKKLDSRTGRHNSHNRFPNSRI